MRWVGSKSSGSVAGLVVVDAIDFGAGDLDEDLDEDLELEESGMVNRWGEKSKSVKAEKGD
jgi:hypothetical protein